MAARKRVATGKWIAARAVRFNKDGSASILKPAARQRNVAGYKDAYGFHPIRWDSDYDPDELSKAEPGYATDGSEPRGFFVGSKRKKRRPAARRRTAKRRPAAKKRRR